MGDIPKSDSEQAHKPKLILVKEDDPNVVIFDHLKNYVSDVVLTLKSHPGYCVVRCYDDARWMHEWKYIELEVDTIENARKNKKTLAVDAQNHFIIHYGDHNYAFDIGFWRMEVGYPIGLVAHYDDDPKRTFLSVGRRGREFQFNDNGTVSPITAPNLCIGLQFDPEKGPGDPFVDDDSNESPEGGTWEKIENVDVARMGNELTVPGWKSIHCISSLKRFIEENAYSGFTINSTDNAAVKNVDFQLTKDHCQASPTTTTYIYTPPERKAKPPGNPKPRLMLVEKGDDKQCVFNIPSNNAKDVELTLKSHPGLAVSKIYITPRDFAEWSFIELQICDADLARESGRLVKIDVEHNFLVCRGDHEQIVDMVLDVEQWRLAPALRAGFMVNLFGSIADQRDKTFLSEGIRGREWFVNKDGTVSQLLQPELVLGLQFDPKSV